MTAAADPNSMAYPPRAFGGTWKVVEWLEMRVRRRMLEGTWSYDLLRALAAELEQDRIDMAGEPDMSSNVPRDVCTQSSALYLEEPATSHQTAAPPVLEAFRAVLTAAEWRETMDTAQPMIVAQREGVIMVTTTEAPDAPSGKRIHLEHIPADLVEAWAHPTSPTIVRKLAVYRLRSATIGGKVRTSYATGDCYWTVDVWDISGEKPTFHTYQLTDPSGNSLEAVDDVTKLYSPNAAGAYPWVWEGRPYIPGVLYHARRGLSRLFDPFYGIELFRGGLFLAVGMTEWRHILRDCSWPQRNAVDLEPAGGVKTSPHTPNTASVATDAASILVWRSKGDKAGTLFQFQPGGDPVSFGNALQNYAAGLCQAYGISAADVQRVAADPRSGYAIALSREGIRKEIARYGPSFAVADRELLGVVAKVANTWLGGAFPVSGWTVTYRGLPKSADERKIEMEADKLDAEMGLASPVDLYIRRYGVTRGEAVDALARIAMENGMLARIRQLTNPPNSGANDGDQGTQGSGGGAGDDRGPARGPGDGDDGPGNGDGGPGSGQG